MQSKTSGWKQLLRWLPGVLISLIAIYAVLKFIKVDDLKMAFQTVKPSLIVILILIQSAGLLIRGKAWQVILGQGVDYKTAFFGVNIGYFLNNVLPFRAGELGRSFFVGRRTGKGTFYVLSTIVIERAFDIVFAASFVILTLPFLIGMDWIKPVATIVLVLVFAALLALFFLARNKEKVIDWTNRITKPGKLMNWILPRIQNIIDGFSLLTKPTQFLFSLMWITISWAVWALVDYFLLEAILPGAPIWQCLFLAGVMALGVAIPSAPSALGVFEASFVAAMAILGAPSGTSLAYALIMHLVQFFTIAIFGVWGLIREGMGFSKILSTIGSNKLTTETTDNQGEGS